MNEEGNLVKTLAASLVLVLLVVMATLGLVGHQAFSAPPASRALSATPAPEVAALPATVPSPTSTTVPPTKALPLRTPVSLPTVTLTLASLPETEERFEAWQAPAPTSTPTPDPREGCDPAYPEERTCIPPGPPFDQGCAITAERLFTVLPPDPQHLDHDNDGIGCEPVS